MSELEFVRLKAITRRLNDLITPDVSFVQMDKETALDILMYLNDEVFEQENIQP
jgi:hypothetical protein